jgi:hypothetical protein
MVPHTHPVSVQVMPDDSPLTVDAYNQLLLDIQIGSSTVMEEVAGIRATLAARKKQALAAARASTATPATLPTCPGLSVEEHNKRREQRDEAFFKRTGLTVAQARNLNAMDLDGPPATRKQPSNHSYSLTHPVKLTHEQKESIKQKLLAPVVRRHSDEPSRRARAAR